MPTAAIIAPGRSFDRTLERVRLAEALGYDAVHVPQMDGHDALTALSAYALSTQRVQLATNVVPIYSRTPATMAQTAATLQQLSGGRFDLGLGVSHRFAVERWHGETMGRPASELKEYVRLVRGILDGRPVAPGRRWKSELRLSGVAPPARVRVYGAGLSPAMLRAVGEVCDGVMLWLCSPAYIQEVVVPEVATGRARAGKPLAGFDIVANVPVAAELDATVAFTALRRQLTAYLRLPFYRAVVERSGFGADLEAGTASDELLRSLVVVGGPEPVQRGLTAYREAGVMTPAVSPIPGLDTDATLRAAAPRPAEGVKPPAGR